MLGVTALVPDWRAETDRPLEVSGLPSYRVIPIYNKTKNKCEAGYGGLSTQQVAPLRKEAVTVCKAWTTQ